MDFCKFFACGLFVLTVFTFVAFSLDSTHFDDIYEDNNLIQYKVIRKGGYFRVHCFQLSDSKEIPEWKSADSFSWRLSREEAQNDLRQFVQDKQLKRVGSR